MSLLHIFCDVDDFMFIFDKWFKSHVLSQAPSTRGRKASLSMSEVMTIIIYFQQSGYREFKKYYKQEVLKYMRPEFPDLVSYNRFIELMPETLFPLCLYLRSRFGRQPVSLLSIRHVCPSATTSGLTVTKSLLRLLLAAKVRWVGFMGSSCI